MKRPAGREKTLQRIARWREICPELTIRSTFIVGFPGETEEDFRILLDWLEAAELDRVGCFRYEPVQGAVANDLAPPVPDAVKEERWHRLMGCQQAISTGRLRRKVGTRQQVIVDEVGARPGGAARARSGTFAAKGRSRGDAPEIDGAVSFQAAGRCGSARSPQSRSSVRTPTICTEPWWGSRSREPHNPGQSSGLDKLCRNVAWLV